MNPWPGRVGGWGMCETCLSTGRRLAPLGDLQRVYSALMDCEPRADPGVCWECAALLRRAARFRQRAARAQAWLGASRPPGGEELLDVKAASTLIATEPVVLAQIHPTDTHLSLDHCPELSKVQNYAEDSSRFDSIENFIDSDKEEEKNNENEPFSQSGFGSVGNDADDDEEKKIENEPLSQIKCEDEYKLFSLFSLKNASHGCTQIIKTKETKCKDIKKPKTSLPIDDNFNFNDSKDVKFTNKPMPHKVSLKNRSLRYTKMAVNVKPVILNESPKLKRSVNTRNSNKTEGMPRSRGRPCSTMSLIKINKDDVLKYRKEELERETFRMAPYKCESCFSILHKPNYTSHILKCHGKETWKWKCDICGVRHYAKSSLDKHVKKHYQLYGCFNCSYKCFGNSRMRYHIERVHINPKEHQCSTCNSTFTDYLKLQQHLKSHKITVNYYECDKCGKKFKDPSKIIKHLKSHELKCCTVCDYSTKKKDNLMQHFQVRHAIAPVLSEVYCVECNKQYYTVLSYENHLASVHCPKPEKVSCPVCNKTFQNNHNLRSHNALFHLKKTKFHCEKCNKYFCGRNGLQGHVRKIHDGIPNPKNVMCNICGRGFSTNRILINHIRTHTGERPYKCEFCSAAFAQKIAMKTHEKNVHIRVMNRKNTDV